MKEEDRATEKACAQAVAEVLGGSLVWRDNSDASPSTHDYDIVLSNGRVIAVEVTAVTLPADRALESELERNFRSPLRGLRDRWLVHIGALPPRERARGYTRDLRATLEKLLPRFESGSPSVDELEDLDRRWPDPRRQVPQHQLQYDKHANSPEEYNPWTRRASEEFGCSEHAVEALTMMHEARIRSVLRQDSGSPLDGPNVIVRSPVRSGHVSPHDLSEAVEREAAKCDNRRKLASASAWERHLVISFDPMSLKGWTRAHGQESLASREQSRTLDLPEEVDTAWAVLASSQPIVWRYNSGGTAWKPLRSVARLFPC